MSFIKPEILDGLRDSRDDDTSTSIRMLQNMTVSDLITLKQEIDKLLPATSLRDMDLEKELVEQYLYVKDLQAQTLTDYDIPANQKAQVANSVSATLQQLVKMQTEFHTAERFKAIEGLMIKYMKKLPLDVAEAFMDDYEGLNDGA